MSWKFIYLDYAALLNKYKCCLSKFNPSACFLLVWIQNCPHWLNQHHNTSEIKCRAICYPIVENTYNANKTLIIIYKSNRKNVKHIISYYSSSRNIKLLNPCREITYWAWDRTPWPNLLDNSEIMVFRDPCEF